MKENQEYSISTSTAAAATANTPPNPALHACLRVHPVTQMIPQQPHGTAMNGDTQRHHSLWQDTDMHIALPPARLPDAERVQTEDLEKSASCDIMVDMWKVLPTETLTWPSPEIFHRDHEHPVTSEAMADPAEQCRPSWTQAAPDPGGYKLLAQLLESSEEDNMVGILYERCTITSWRRWIQQIIRPTSGRRGNFDIH